MPANPVKKEQTSPQKLALSLAITSALLSGYGGRKAYAGSCTGADGIYSCSGVANSATDTTQLLPTGAATALTITTDDTFGIDSSLGNGTALSLTGTGGLSFIDNEQSNITSTFHGLLAVNNTSGRLKVTTSGTVTGKYGIYASNTAGTTYMDITANGPIVGTGPEGIKAQNHGTGTLQITTKDTVTGGEDAIEATNWGTGSLSIQSEGSVYGKFGEGISCLNYGASVTIEAAEVTGRGSGIFVFNKGSDSLSITTTGTLIARGIAKGGKGIEAINEYGTSSLAITTASVLSDKTAIVADHRGDEFISIKTNGDVTSATNNGIFASNSVKGTYLAIETGAKVIGYNKGIVAFSYGSGNVTITTSGSVEAHEGYKSYGIYAYTYDLSTNITINSRDVSGNERGIFAITGGVDFDSGIEGRIEITTNGDVSGLTGIAVWRYDNKVNATLNINNAPSGEVGSVSSTAGDGGYAIDLRYEEGDGVDGVDGDDGDDVINIAAGVVITGSINLGDHDDTVYLNEGVTISGSIDFGSGSNDILVLVGDVSGNPYTVLNEEAVLYDRDSDGSPNVCSTICLAAGMTEDLDDDNDGMTDEWEIAHGLEPLVDDAGDDADGDKLTNIEEFNAETDPNNSDTDNDGMTDRFEIDEGFDPNDGSDCPDWLCGSSKLWLYKLLQNNP